MRDSLVAIFFIFAAAQASAFQGRMETVSIVQCGVKSCATVSGPSADVSFFSTNLSLQKAKLSLRQQLHGKTQEYNVSEIYFDNNSQRIYLHGVAELKNSEAFYDLRSEVLTVFN